VYAAQLAGTPGYTGPMERFRFDPVISGMPGATVNIAWISRSATGPAAAVGGR
jgi:hypothetical protein